jgi:hypothetical protein
MHDGLERGFFDSHCRTSDRHDRQGDQQPKLSQAHRNRFFSRHPPNEIGNGDWGAKPQPLLPTPPDSAVDADDAVISLPDEVMLESWSL